MFSLFFRRTVVTACAAACLLAWTIAPHVPAAEPPVSSPETKRSQDAAPAEAAPKAPLFLRLVRTPDKKIQSLDTAVVRYRSSKTPDVYVDLVAVVHLGEKDYYAKLNQRFRTEYDAVLYELVAPRDAVPKPGERSGSPIGLIQRGMTRLLQLQFQLDGIDYQAKNFVHADFTPAEFLASMKKRDETFWIMALRMFKASLKAEMENEDATLSDWDLLRALLSPDRARRLKAIMAEQLARSDGFLKHMGGPKGTTLIEGRNEKAVQVLKDQLKQGKKRLAIFYGAGHMPDFHKRLRALGFKPDKTTWLVAWAIAPCK